MCLVYVGKVILVHTRVSIFWHGHDMDIFMSVDFSEFMKKLEEIFFLRFVYWYQRETFGV